MNKIDLQLFALIMVLMEIDPCLHRGHLAKNSLKVFALLLGQMVLAIEVRNEFGTVQRI